MRQLTPSKCNDGPGQLVEVLGNHVRARPVRVVFIYDADQGIVPTFMNAHSFWAARRDIYIQDAERRLPI